VDQQGHRPVPGGGRPREVTFSGGRGAVIATALQLTVNGLAFGGLDARVDLERRGIVQLQLEEGKTKRVVALLSALNVEGKALISMGAHDENTVRAARNLPGVKTLPAANLNALDLLDYDTLILTREGVDVLERFLA